MRVSAGSAHGPIRATKAGMARRPQRVWALCAPLGALLLAASCDLNPHPEPPGTTPQTAQGGAAGATGLTPGNSTGGPSAIISGPTGSGAFRGNDAGIITIMPPPSTGGTLPP